MNTNTPVSYKGNLIRYIVFLILYLITLGFKALSVLGNNFHLVSAIFFIIIGLFTLLFYIRRFNREQRYFRATPSLSLIGDYSFGLGMTILVIASRILVSYLQAKGKLALSSFQLAYLKHEATPIFWFFIFSIGILLPVLQQFLVNGFFFNYFFRKTNVISAVVGVICSGIFFSLLSGQYTLSLLVVNMIYGMAFAWSYLYSQTLWVPIYLAVLNGIFTVILI